MLPVLEHSKRAKNSLIFQKCAKYTLTLMSNYEMSLVHADNSFITQLASNIILRNIFYLFALEEHHLSSEFGVKGSFFGQ